MQERRLQWFGHVERREEDYIGKRVKTNLEVSASRAVGRPKKTWRNRVIEDMRDKGVSAEEAQDRATWKRLTKNVDPA
ncbi:hypothetical protein M8J77_013028 [Diaphorina citri]|nr:hypothetical protein M8J77_013028 [Diaphorina citri]